MKALVLKKNGVLSVESVAKPAITEEQCLVKVHAAGICNSDIPRAFDNGAYSYPLIMGHEFSGQIEETGGKVTRFKKGQRVTVFPLLPCFKCASCARRDWAQCLNYDYYGSRRNGAFCEYVAVNQWNLMAVPDKCDIRLAALCEPVSVCVHTLGAVPAKTGGRAAVLGGGFMGLIIAKLLQSEKEYDEVTVIDRNQFKLDIAAGHGLKTKLLEFSKGTDLSSSSDNDLYDLVIEACGAVDTYRLSTALCAHSGTVIWMGNIRDRLSFEKKEISSILRRELTVQGVWNSRYEPEGESDWSRALELIASEKWIGDLVSHRPGLDEGIEILNDLHAIKSKHQPHQYLKACFQF